MNTPPDIPDRHSVLKNALLEMKTLRAKLKILEYSRKEPIAIIGMGCRFPGGSSNPEALWELLCNGVDAVVPVPQNRWDVDSFYDPRPEAPGKTYMQWGAFLDEVDSFDASFFNISPREAVSIDPQQRLLLEVSWEALENAGLAPNQLFGSLTGVFVGICANDYTYLQMQKDYYKSIDAYRATGNALSVASGRLSYTLGLKGPSLSVDTACSSSLVAVHLACQSLRNSESNLAIVGSANLILSPYASIAFAKSRMLASDGRCKTFDAAADGFTRGEGCGVVILKRLSDAIKDRDNILALIRGTAINQDGASSGLTVPNGPSQQIVIRQALANADVSPELIDYVEAHGTGTALGDPIEVQALGEVFQARPADSPLVIGSIKTNIGHLEAAAGIAGLMKVVLSLQHQQIPPHLHFKKPNTRISWADIPLTVPTKLTYWNAENKRRYAGLSSFGFSGTNAHIIFEEAPIKELEHVKIERPVNILTLSAKSPQALKQLAKRFKHHLTMHPSQALADVCFTANTGRSHFSCRLAIVAPSASYICNQLAEFLEKQEFAGMVRFGKQTDSRPKVAFLFTGQGSQYLEMGRYLYETQATFRKVLDQCNELLQPDLPQPLLSVLYPRCDATPLLHETQYAQPALFSLEYALAELWRSWGVVPEAVMGHSVGEYVAACVAGVFSWEDGLKLIAQRGRLMQSLPCNGMMAAVQTNKPLVLKVLSAYQGLVSIAAVNSLEQIVISGEHTAMQAVIEELRSESIPVHLLQVSHAFHSPLMEPILKEFRQIAQQVKFNTPQIPLVSNLTGQIWKSGKPLDADYWCQHIREPVEFMAGIQSLATNNYKIFVELGPNPTLSRLGQQCLSENNVFWLSSLVQGQSDWQVMLNSLGTLYCQGRNLDWVGFDQNYPRYRIPLPTYPFERERYWFDESHSLPLNSSDDKKVSITKSKAPIHPLLGKRISNSASTGDEK
ncbi:MAG: type I polyketide synthase [Nostoc sp. DedQUE08]|uniref:type I polyketide synthase n=1 Tax=Nostoc sp. DedQUE08 TaxID=3075393 RepID=UPI002AD40ACA|nr:type I polyketide synthase [Nostoc sp. DedQUE08]MDZ8068509.1 type I polyketide synthase [Nostoc sp. DedQUE08]